MTAKDIIKELHNRMEEGQELEIFPQDWKVFGRVANMFSDEILEAAIKMFPKHNVETPSRLFMFLCKKASKGAKPTPKLDLPTLFDKM